MSNKVVVSSLTELSMVGLILIDCSPSARSIIRAQTAAGSLSHDYSCWTLLSWRQESCTFLSVHLRNTIFRKVILQAFAHIRGFVSMFGWHYRCQRRQTDPQNRRLGRRMSRCREEASFATTYKFRLKSKLPKMRVQCIFEINAYL